MGADNVTWAFNFTRLYRKPGDADYSFINSSSNIVYAFNVGGYSNTLCAATYATQYNWGVAVRLLPGQAPPTQCYLTNGTQVPCTGPCQVLAIGAPVWVLSDPTNGSTGGVTMLYKNVWTLPDDPNLCPVNPYSGEPTPFAFSLVLTCDPTVDTLRVQSVQEEGCATVVTAGSAAACGVPA